MKHIRLWNCLKTSHFLSINWFRMMFSLADHHVLWCKRPLLSLFSSCFCNIETQPISLDYHRRSLIKSSNDSINKKNFTPEKRRIKLWIGSMFACVIVKRNRIFKCIVLSFSLVTKATFISINSGVCCVGYSWLFLIFYWIFKSWMCFVIGGWTLISILWKALSEFP